MIAGMALNTQKMAFGPILQKKAVLWTMQKKP